MKKNKTKLDNSYIIIPSLLSFFKWRGNPLNTCNKKGFTLVEVCIGALILMVLLIPVFTLMSQGSSGTIHNRNEILARVYITNIISFCNTISFEDPKLSEVDSVEDNAIKDKLGMTLDVNGKTIDLEESIDKAFLNMVTKKTLSIKDINVEEIGCRYKFITVSIKWKDPSKKNEESIETTGMVTER